MLEENLIKIYETSFRENREMPALTDYFKGETFSYYEMAKEIAKLHLLFKKAGVKKGDKIALIGRNNPRWCITYIATISYGAVIVPILQDFAPADIIHIINHSESKLLFLGDNFWDIIEEDQIRQIEAVFSLTDFHAIYERNGKALTKFQRDILKNYRSKYPRGFSVNDIKYPEIPNDEVILLNYTSGTTGYSKGVMLTVNNLTGNVSFARGMVNTQTGTHYFRKGGRTLSFLPLAHAYGCAFDFLSPLAVGGHITLLGKIPSPKILLEAMSVVKPTIICCVPMILEKVYRKQVMPMLEKGPMSIAVKIPLLNTAIYSVIRKKLLDAFGGWSVWWDSSRKVAAAASGSQSVTANPSRNTVTVNGRTYSGKVFVERGRTYIPLRTLATALGGSVAWDPQLGGAAVTSPGADHNAMDLYWLSRIISAESRGENMTGQIAVGNVVLNRVAAKEFPNTIPAVIFDRKHDVQFTPVSNGTVSLPPTAKSVEAAKRVLNGENTAGKALYFYAPALSQGTWINANRAYLKTIGCHRFYL